MRGASSLIFGAALCAVSVGACANILGYDELRVRSEGDASVEAADTPPANEAATDAETGVVPAHPPSRPPGVVVPSGKGKTLSLVVNHFYLNQEEIGGGPTTKNPWRRIGFDLDKVCTGEKESRENTGTCRRVSGADQLVLMDGDACRDNNFGSQVVPLVSSFDAQFEKTSNEAVGNGSSTWLIVLEDVDDGPDDPFVVGKVYKAATWPTYPDVPPKWDGTDERDIDEGSVNDKDASKPKTLFPSGWIRDHVWVSGAPADIEITVPIQTASATMPLVSGVMTLRLDEAHTRGELGILGGAIPAARMDDVVRPLAEQAGVCPGTPLYESLKKGFSRMMDVVVEAPDLQSTSATCNGLTVGLGFKAIATKPPTRVVPPWTYPSRCGGGDAGVDGG